MSENTQTALATIPARNVQRALALAGWQLLSMDIDLSRETARIELRSGDRLVTFDARSGSASITRETVSIQQVRVGRRGDVFRADRLSIGFVGRDRFPGVRSGLRALAQYVADNGNGALSMEGARNTLRLVMDSAPHRLAR